MEEEDNKDLKQGENGTQEEQSNSENESAEDSDGLKEKEDSKAKADKLLDGTDKDKRIQVKKTVFDDKNDKAKLYEAHADLLDKVLKDPDAVNKYLSEKGGDDVESRIAAIEADRKSEKRSQMREAVAELISSYSDFEQSWTEVQPIANSLMTQGFSVKTAMRRAYLAVHPEAAEKESKRLADEALNREGEVRGGGLPTRPQKGKRDLSESERVVAQHVIRQGFSFVQSEEDYAKLLEKHKDTIDRWERQGGE